MNDKSKSNAEPEELADETLNSVEGGRGFSSAKTTRTTVKAEIKPVVKPIGGVGETPPLDLDFTLETK